MADTKTYVLGRKTLADLDNEDLQEVPSELMTINMGPSHPAMHGTVRIVLTVDGERIVASDVQPGFLHRCFEKESEHATYTQIFPYTDRLNYVSPMINNVGFAMAVEKLLDITEGVPERAEYIRVIISEISRLTDHLTCIGASAMELGAFTAFLYFLKAREWLYTLLEELSGARLTHSYVRVGGVSQDLTPDFDTKLEGLLIKIEGVMVEVEGLLSNNKIFRDRMEGVGAFSRE
jgi:NADH-quinone oxidoreductase subunit D